MKKIVLIGAVRQTRGIFVKQVVFVTVTHRGALILREVHFIDETIMWRDPGGFEPVNDLFTRTSEITLLEAVTSL